MTLEHAVSQARAFRAAAQHHREQAAELRRLASQHAHGDARTPALLTIIAGHDAQAVDLDRSADACERRAICAPVGYLISAH